MGIKTLPVNGEDNNYGNGLRAMHLGVRVLAEEVRRGAGEVAIPHKRIGMEKSDTTD